MNFKDKLKMNASLHIDRYNARKYNRMIAHFKRMQEDGTLNKFHKELKEMLLETISNVDFEYDIFKDAILKNIYQDYGVYQISLTQRLNGSIILDKKVPNRLIEIVKLSECVRYNNFNDWLADKKIFEVKIQNDFIGYIDSQGQLRISSDIDKWNDRRLEKMFHKLKSKENISAKKENSKIIFAI